jgi:histone-lysine N-methyltransferase SETD1
VPRSSTFSHFLHSSLSVLPLDIVVVVQTSTTMSGKAPPRGPRALLGSLPQLQQNQTASSSSQSTNPPPQPQTPQSSPTALSATPVKRIGAVPPTGPRSLTNGRQPPPPGPKQLLNGRSSPTSSSPIIPTGPHALQSNRHPISIKGKIPDKPSGVRQNASVRIS